MTRRDGPDATVYAAVTGGGSQALPKDLQPKNPFFSHLSRWGLEESAERIHHALCAEI